MKNLLIMLGILFNTFLITIFLSSTANAKDIINKDELKEVVSSKSPYKEGLFVGIESLGILNLGVMGGYQYYFKSYPDQGLRTTLHFNAGVLEKFNAGLDLTYLWDFFHRNKHSLGLSAGLGVGSHKFIIYPALGLHYYYKSIHMFQLSFYSYNATLSYSYRFNFHF